MTSQPDWLKREQGFILRCLREIVWPGQTEWEEMRESLNDLDWMEVLQCAQQGRVLGFVTSALHGRDLLGELPRPLQVQLMASLLRYEQDCSARKKQFARLAGVLGEQAINFAPLKGAALCSLIYEDLPIRVMSDLDLLIRPVDFDRLLSAIAPMGFVLEDSFFRNRWHGTLHEASYRRKTLAGGDFDLDVHFDIRYLVGRQMIGMDSSDIWARAIPCRALGESAWLLSPLDQARHLFTHLTEGSSPALVQLLDVALLVKKYGLSALELPSLEAPTLKRSARLRLGAMAALIDHLFFQPGGIAALPASCGPELANFFAGQASQVRAKRLTSAIDYLTVLTSWRQRALFALGFLFPNPRYYGAAGESRGLLKHSRHRLKSIAKMTAKP